MKSYFLCFDTKKLSRTNPLNILDVTALEDVFRIWHGQQ